MLLQYCFAPSVDLFLLLYHKDLFLFIYFSPLLSINQFRCRYLKILYQFEDSERCFIATTAIHNNENLISKISNDTSVRNIMQKKRAFNSARLEAVFCCTNKRENKRTNLIGY